MARSFGGKQSGSSSSNPSTDLESRRTAGQDLRPKAANDSSWSGLPKQWDRAANDDTRGNLPKQWDKAANDETYAPKRIQRSAFEEFLSGFYSIGEMDELEV